jgi:hypothetical protein
MVDVIFLEKIPEDGIIPRIKVNPDEKWIKHVCCEGARFHVLYYCLAQGKAIVLCSEPDCIYNKPK